MSRHQAFFKGLKTSLPIMAGYLPVGFAFGVAAEGAHFGTSFALFTSLFIYAGASQFALVGLLKDGVSLITAAFITVGLNIRHFLYGPGLSGETEELKLSQRLITAFGLTDEVFSVAFSKIKEIPVESRFWWLLGLEIGAYASWVLSTFMGSFGGKALLNNFSFLGQALSFALPALFFSLLLSMLQKGRRLAVVIALAVAATFQLNGHPEIGIIAAAFIGPITGIIWIRQ
ncbi:MAG: AzlC family protein [Deltaproteobacteria bacterium]|nr:AzlC family protein [Deltaproteobacteria bacterium]|tara:strand:+ start:5061 stop:5750 length:690 start_codon:yes stop_codon:yes gene_type:complete